MDRRPEDPFVKEFWSAYGEIEYGWERVKQGHRRLMKHILHRIAPGFNQPDNYPVSQKISTPIASSKCGTAESALEVKRKMKAEEKVRKDPKEKVENTTKSHVNEEVKKKSRMKACLSDSETKEAGSKRKRRKREKHIILSSSSSSESDGAETESVNSEESKDEETKDV